MRKIVQTSVIIILLSKMVFGIFSGGLGTSESPFEISNAKQLDSIRLYMDKSFILSDDIDLNIDPYNTSEGWKPIGVFYSDSIPFVGSFNGNGFTIKNLYINSINLNVSGLFGFVKNASIRNVKLTGCDINSTSDVGGIAGISWSSNISNCSVSGEIIGSNSVGGIVGQNYENSLLENSYSNVDIFGNTIVGGLVGSSSGVSVNDTSRVINCYSNSIVTAFDYAGGLVGVSDNSGVIKNCYSVGTVSVIKSANFYSGAIAASCKSENNSNCYYNSEISGFTDNSDGIPKTTEEMQLKETYENWDFDNIWTITDNSSYPTLKEINSYSSILIKGTSYQYTPLNEPFKFTLDMVNYTYESENGGTILLKILKGDNYTVTDTNIAPDSNFTGELLVNFLLTDGITSSPITKHKVSVDVINNSPTILSKAPIEAYENQEYTYTILAIDEDTILTYSLSKNPVGMTINKNIISWTPPVGTTTSGVVYLSVTDVNGFTSIEIFKIKVSEQNLPPKMVSTIIDSATEDIPYEYVFDIEDEDDDSLITVKLLKYPTGIIQTDSSIIWTPLEGVLTSGNIIVSLTDTKGFFSLDTFIIYVKAVNDAPIIFSTPKTNAVIGVTYIYDIMCSDIDNGNIPVTFNVENMPDGMTLRGNRITWKPTVSSNHAENIFITVTDKQGLFTTQTFSIYIDGLSSNIKLEEQSSDDYSIIVAPSPTRDIAKIIANSNREGRATFTLYSKNSKKLFTISKSIEERKKLQFIWNDINKLPKDVYFIEMKINGERKAVSKLTKVE